MVFAPWLALHPADSSDFSESETGEEAERETQIPLKVSLIWQLVPERGAWLDILMGAPHALSGVDF